MATLTPTKTSRTLQASTSSPAGGPQVVSSAIDLTGKFGGLLMIRMTNGTAPTIGCTAYVEVSTDAATWRTMAALTHATTASLTSDYPVSIPDSVMHLRVRFAGNTGQAVTVEAYLQELTSIASA